MIMAELPIFISTTSSMIIYLFLFSYALYFIITHITAISIHTIISIFIRVSIIAILFLYFISLFSFKYFDLCFFYSLFYIYFNCSLSVLILTDFFQFIFMRYINVFVIISIYIIIISILFYYLSPLFCYLLIINTLYFHFILFFIILPIFL